MSPTKPAAEEPPDPSMEDILASIRRILNDDGTEGAPAEGAVTTPEQAEDDVFLLDETMLIKEPPQMVPESSKAESAPNAAEESLVPHAASAEDEAPLVAPTTAAAASASLGALVRVVSQRQTAVYRGGPTIEDVVREEIRPIVKEWLDENLAPMVERMVRIEIERVTRGG